MNHPIRLLHASDFHLGDSFSGLTDISPEIRKRLLAAPYRAVSRITQAAIDAKVDLVALSGNLLDPRTCGARAIAFLWEQIERMAEAKIPVFWCLGQADHARHWQDTSLFPTHAEVFVTDHVERKVIDTSEGLVTVLGSAWGADDTLYTERVDRGPYSGPCIVLGHGKVDRAADFSDADYWALGGSARRHQIETSTSVVHYAGTPQPRSIGQLSHASPFGGCTLVEIDESGRADLKTLRVDDVEWKGERITLDEADGPLLLKELIEEHIVEWELSDERVTLAHWIVEGGDVSPTDLPELVKQLNTADTPVWTTCIESRHPAACDAEWGEEDSILGDYVRSIDELAEADEGEVVDLAAILRMTDEPLNVQPNWQDVLDDAARVGVRRLSGKDAA